MDIPRNIVQQHVGPRQIDHARHVATTYAEHLDTPDVDAIEAGLRIGSIELLQSEALLRLFAHLGSPITGPRLTVLRALYFAKTSLSQNDIRIELGLTAPTVSFLMDSMEAEGLVERTRSAIDRREVLISLTDNGKRISSNLVPQIPGYFTEMFKGFSRAEKRTLNRLLKRLHVIAECAYMPGSS